MLNNNVVDVSEYLKKIQELGNKSYTKIFQDWQAMPMFVVIRDRFAVTIESAVIYDLLRTLEITIPDTPNRIEKISGLNPKNHREAKDVEVIEVQVNDFVKQGMINKMWHCCTRSFPEFKAGGQFPLYPAWLYYYAPEDFRRTEPLLKKVQKGETLDAEKNLDTSGSVPANNK